MAKSEPGADFWNERYASVDRVWARKPNALLTEFATKLLPGRAVDIGAGEGRNAIWLVQQGWTVTAIDISDVGLGRAADRAAQEGFELETFVGDWREYESAEPFDLAVISFMHPRENHMFEWARELLVPGGYLFTVGVDLSELGKRGPKDPDKLYTPERLRAALAGFEVLRCEKVAYQGESTEGPKPVVDSVAIARRPLE